MALIGLDIGTTGCKAIVFDDDGRALGRGAREYPVLTPRAGWAEQDAEQVWGLAWAALAEALAASGGAQPVALALSVQGEAIIPVDAAGRALRHAILGMDTRTEAECAWLAERVGADGLYRRTGQPTHTINSLPKLLWLRANEPELWAAAAQFLLYEDFFLGRLGGRAVISHCLASRTQLYRLAAGDWDDELLSTCGLERRRLAALAPADGVVGELRPALAAELGLRRPPLLVSGGHDQACAALGSGVLEPGQAMVSTGTAEVVEVAMAEPALAEPLRRGGISVYRHVVPGRHLAMTLNHSGGLLLRWFRDTCCAGERAAAGGGADAYDLILRDAPAGPTDLLVLPHFAGAGTPTLDTGSRGAILGLSFATTRATIARAILEGLTFELRQNLELLHDGGAPIRELRAVGGGARSGLWLRLKADICRVPLLVPEVTEAACLGAALLAGVAAGAYPSLADGVRAAVRAGATVEPDAAAAARYDERYAAYRQVYPAVRPIGGAQR